MYIGGRKVHTMQHGLFVFFSHPPASPFILGEGLQRSQLVLDTAYPRASTLLTRLSLVGRVSTFHCLSLGIRTRTFVFKPISYHNLRNLYVNIQYRSHQSCHGGISRPVLQGRGQVQQAGRPSFVQVRPPGQAPPHQQLGLGEGEGGEPLHEQ